MASGDTKTEALLNILGHGGSVDGITGSGNTKTQDYLVDAIGRLQGIQDEVDELKNNPDVVDIVDTYADLQAYDTQHLSDNDIIRVLADETHSGNSTYYKFNKQAGTWTFIGEISGGSITPVQTPGNSQTDVMSQDATTSMIFNDPSTRNNIVIGRNTSLFAPNYGVIIGFHASGRGDAVAIGSNANPGGTTGAVVIGADAAAPQSGVAIGKNSSGGTITGGVAIGCYSGVGTAHKGGVALGAYAIVTRIGEVNIGSSSTDYGYNSTNYRVLGGVHDPVDAHDAATKGYVDGNKGLTRLYLSSSSVPHSGSSTISIYSDKALTNSLSGEDVCEIMRKGNIELAKVITGDHGGVMIYSVYIAHVPDHDTEEDYDEYFPPEINIGSGAATWRIVFDPDPSATDSFYITKMS